MSKFFNKLKKPYFWPIFSEKPSHAKTSYEFLTSSHNLEKIPHLFLENAWAKRRMDGRKDIPHFTGLLRLPPGVLQIVLFHNWTLFQSILNASNLD